MIERELTDQQMALRIIGRMDTKVTLKTIIQRLNFIEAAIQLSALMVHEGVGEEPEIVNWLERMIESYDRQR